MRKLALFTTTLLAASLAQAADTGTFALLPYAPESVSADGLTVVGDNLSSSADNLWMWKAGTVTNIGGKSAINPGAGNVYANPDGSRIYGTAIDANGVRNVSAYNVATGQWTSLGGLGGYSASAGLNSDPSVNAAAFNATGTAWGASANGKYIVGQSYQTGNGTNNTRATIWNLTTGTIINLGNNPGVTAGPNQRTRAQGISDDGRVVGGFGGSGNVPLVWTDLDGDGTYTAINVSTASGKTVNGVFGVSANGQYAVGAGFINNTNGSAYRFNVNTNGIDMLGKLNASSGGTDTATGVSGTGSVIVGYEDVSSGAPSSRSGFIWIDGLGIQSLDTYLAGWGIDTGNTFNFTTPTAISADGLTIVGVGFAVGASTSQGFVVNLPAAAAVPEPSSYALLLAGLGLTGFVARRRRAA